jgi:ribosomal protein L11 methyltransferase
MLRLFVTVAVEVPKGAGAKVRKAFQTLGAASVEDLGAVLPTMKAPGLAAPVDGRQVLAGYFATKEAADAAAEALRTRFSPTQQAFGVALASPEPQAPKKKPDYPEELKAFFKPVETRRLWAGPPWAVERAPKRKKRIVVAPGSGFGNGNHPTTFGCLRALDAYLAKHPKVSLLDVGTGSGILAIAAKKLGAGRTVGVDIDPHAIESAKRIAAEHKVEVELSLQKVEEVKGRFDLVIANIRPWPLMTLAPAIAPKVRKRLVLSGLHHHERAPVEKAFEAEGMKVIEAEEVEQTPELLSDGPSWWVLHLGPPPRPRSA